MKPEMMATLRMRKTVASTELTPEPSGASRLASPCEAKGPQLVPKGNWFCPVFGSTIALICAAR